MANQYWVTDSKSRILGPLTREALLDLVRNGRVNGIAGVSTDRENWRPVEEDPELAGLQASHTGEARRLREQQEATKLRAKLAAMEGRPPHEIFRLPPDASVDRLRTAFFAVVKRYHPERLPPDAAPELRAAYMEVFAKLSSLMADVERQAAAPAEPPATVAPVAPIPLVVLATPAGEPMQPPGEPLPRQATPLMGVAQSPVARQLTPLLGSPQVPIPRQPSRPPPTLAPTGQKTIGIAALQETRSATFKLEREALSSQEPAGPPKPPPRPLISDPAPAKKSQVPSYALSDFVGLERRHDDRVQANVKVTAETCSIFADNKLLNISQNGAFIPCPQALPLGLDLDLVFQFDDPAREVKAAGKVVWWRAGDAKQLRGFGVRFTKLEQADRKFIEDFVRKAMKPGGR